MSASADLAGLALGLLVDTGLKATVALAGAGLVAGALPRASAAARHAVWTGALASVPLMAGWTLWHRGSALGLSLGALWPSSGALWPSSGALWPSSGALWPSSGPLWLALWALGATVVLAPLVRGIAALMGFKRRGLHSDGVVWVRTLDAPLTFARTIFMPDVARSWSPDQQRSARLHEAAHVRRGDWWVHVGAWIVCALLWFHPLVWWARRRLVLEAERAADDCVLAAGVQPSAYAQLLVGLARGPAAGLSMGPSDTGVRVRAILGTPHRGARRWPVAMLWLAVVGAAGPAWADWALWAPPPPLVECRSQRMLP